MVDMKEIVAACVNYIEDNIYTKITLDDIAGQAGISKYHLHRMFKSLTGESFVDYVHSRKLSASINELIHTNMRIIDIALEYGFDYEQSYIRAFRKKFGHTPLKVRVENLSFIITEKLNVHDILSVNNSIIYKPFFVYKPKMYLIGQQHKIVSKSGDRTANVPPQTENHQRRQSRRLLRLYRLGLQRRRLYLLYPLAGGAGSVAHPRRHDRHRHPGP